MLKGIDWIIADDIQLNEILVEDFGSIKEY